MGDAHRLSETPIARTLLQMETAALEVRNLTKTYGEFTAVNSISFAVPRGSAIGLLGPNGAGKTTTMQMLTGITEMTSGHIQYFGLDFRRHRRTCLQRINFTSAYDRLQSRITVLENLKSFALLYSVPDAEKTINELGDFFGIRDLFDQRFRTLSAGQSTDLLLMDEPTASLDPDVRARTMDMIEDMRDKRNLSILYTSHNMDEVARLCDEVIFLDHGNIVKQDTPANLTAELSQNTLAVTYAGASRESIHSALSGLGVEVKHEGERTAVMELDVSRITQTLQTIEGLPGVSITDIEIRKADLEDVFLNLARRQNIGGDDVVVSN
jgi:ABC-2 type transport system ATP-binding protein